MGLWKIFLHYLSSSSIIIQNLSMILNFISKIWRFNFYCSGFKKKYHLILRCHPWLAITLNRISQWPCNWKKSMISKSHSIAYTDYCSEQRHKILVKQNPWQLIFHIINSQKHSFRFYDQKKYKLQAKVFLEYWCRSRERALSSDVLFPVYTS